jgi:hypothetical protein
MSTNVRTGTNRFQQAHKGVIVNTDVVFHTSAKIAYNVIQGALWMTLSVQQLGISTKSRRSQMSLRLFIHRLKTFIVSGNLCQFAAIISASFDRLFLVPRVPRQTARFE